MEAYAIAKICYLENIRFKCFKFISDHADGGASNDWIENVSLGKKLFVKRIKNLENATRDEGGFGSELHMIIKTIETSLLKLENSGIIISLHFSKGIEKEIFVIIKMLTLPLKKSLEIIFEILWDFSFSIKIPNYCHKALPLNI